VLEDANIKLAAVVTDIRGVSARAMLEALIAGQRDVAMLAALARGRLRTKRDQLEAAIRGAFTPHHGFLLTEYLSQLDSFDEAIDRVRAIITQHLAAEQEAIALLDTIPGVSQRTAEILLLRHPGKAARRATVGAPPGRARLPGGFRTQCPVTRCGSMVPYLARHRPRCATSPGGTACAACTMMREGQGGADA
jgi:hypothetical protein